MSQNTCVLSMVSGMHLNLNDVPQQACPPYSLKFTDEKSAATDKLIQEFLYEHAIVLCNHEDREYVNTTFTKDIKWFLETFYTGDIWHTETVCKITPKRNHSCSLEHFEHFEYKGE